MTASTLPKWSTSSWERKTHAHVVGVDEREQVLEVLVAVDGCAAVDDHGLGGPDDHRVHVDDLGGDALADVVGDHERVGRDLDRRDAGLGGGGSGCVWLHGWLAFWLVGRRSQVTRQGLVHAVREVGRAVGGGDEADDLPLAGREREGRLGGVGRASPGPCRRR